VVGTPWVTLAPIWSVGAMVDDRVKTASVHGPADITPPRHMLACNSRNYRKTLIVVKMRARQLATAVRRMSERTMVKLDVAEDAIGPRLECPAPFMGASAKKGGTLKQPKP